MKHLTDAPIWISDVATDSENGVVAVCPACGQILMEVVKRGHGTQLKVKCRRCRRFVGIDLE